VSAQEYTLVDLGTLGGTYSRANGISENGIIAGYATSGSGKHAVLWTETGIADIGGPQGSIISDAVAVNDSNQVAGYDEGSPQTYQGYSWESGSWTPLGFLPGHSESIARDIDSAGRIVGSSFILGQEHRAVMWDAGVLTDLGTLGDSSNAYGINDVGQVVGYSVANLPGGEQQLRGFLWENGQMTALDPLPEDVATQAFDVNDAGDVVGSSTWYTTQFLSASQATLWLDGGEVTIDLGYVPAPPWSCSAEPRWHKSIARAVNNRGQIVGEAMCIASGAPKAAFLWQDGVMHNLNDLIPAGSGLDLRSALDINDAGQIVGYGITPDEEIHAFLLAPPRLPGDINGDGEVGIADFLLLLAAWGPCPDPPDLCPADLDGDGTVSVNDFLTLLANWS
jgi:probable HAF family extracellular repeat protein